MKKIFWFSLLFFAVIFKAQDHNTEYLGLAEPLELNGTEFFLDYSNHPSKTLYTQQYLPKDEKFDEFGQLLGFTYFTKDIDIEEAVQQKVKMMEERQKEDKFATVNVTESPDGKEFIVDFTVSGNTEKKSPYIEYNIYRFKKYENGDQKSFLILSYAARKYGDLKSSAKAFSKERNNLVGMMIEYKIPELKADTSAAVSQKK